MHWDSALPIFFLSFSFCFSCWHAIWLWLWWLVLHLTYLTVNGVHCGVNWIYKRYVAFYGGRHKICYERKNGAQILEKSLFRLYCETMTYHTYERWDKKPRDIWNTFTRRIMMHFVCVWSAFYRAAVAFSLKNRTERAVPQTSNYYGNIEHDSDSATAWDGTEK